MVVPEQRHALLERRGRRDHLAHPPDFDFQPLTQLLLALRLLLFPAFKQSVRNWRGAGHKIRSRELRLRRLCLRDKPRNGSTGALTCQAINLCLCGRESHTAQQMASLTVGKLLRRCRQRMYRRCGERKRQNKLCRFHDASLKHLHWKTGRFRSCQQSKGHSHGSLSATEPPGYFVSTQPPSTAQTTRPRHFCSDKQLL